MESRQQIEAPELKVHNRRRVEPIDLTADGQRQAFIERYLELRAHDLSDVNRLIVDCGVASYSEGSTTTRRDLTGYLDHLYSLHSF